MEEKTTMKFYTIKLKSCAQFGDFSGGASIKERTFTEEVNKLNFTKHQLWQWMEDYESRHENGSKRTEKWDKNLTIEDIVRIFQKSAYGITLEIEEKPCKKQPKATSKPWEDAKPLPFAQEQLDEALSDQKNSTKEKKIKEEKKTQVEIRLNYIGKGKCINDIIIRGEKGENVTEADLNKTAEAIRGGKFHVFENDEGNLWLFGWIEDEDGRITFGADEDSLSIVYGEGDKPIKVSCIVTVSKSDNDKLNSQGVYLNNKEQPKKENKMKIYKIKIATRAKINRSSPHYYSEMEIREEKNHEEDESYTWELNDLSSWLANYAIHYGVAISEEAQERIDQNYTVEQIVKEYQDIIDGISLEIEESEE